MLPFLKNKQDASVSAPVSSPSEPIPGNSDQEPEYDMLHAAAEDLLHAVHAGDAPAIADALRAAFQLCESEPHDEGSYE